MQPQTALTARVNAALKAYDPNQPRDAEGQWTDTGGGGGGAQREDNYKRKRWEDMSRNEQHQAAADRILQLHTRAQLAENENSRAEAQQHIDRINRMRTTDYDRWETSMKDWQNGRAARERAANRSQEAQERAGAGQQERQRFSTQDADRERYLRERQEAISKPLRGKLVSFSEKAVLTTAAASRLAVALNQASATSDYVTAARKLVEARDAFRDLAQASRGLPAEAQALRQELSVKMRVAQIRIQRASARVHAQLAGAGPKVKTWLAERGERKASRAAARAAASAAARREAQRRTRTK